MRTAIFPLLLLAAPALLAQSAQTLTVPPGAVWPSEPPGPILLAPQTSLAPQTQDWWAQPPGSSWSGQTLAQNRPFEFAVPRPQAPAGKMEPIPTQWPSAKFESIPTRWKNLKVVPADGAAAAAAESGSSALFAQPARK
jgi:hypothetical protein